jgi:hypothetical protein
MWKLRDVKAIEYRRDRVFHITFDDGLEGEVDFAEYIVSAAGATGAGSCSARLPGAAPPGVCLAGRLDRSRN